MIEAADIREQLRLVASGEVSLNAFEQWLDPHIWNMELESPDDAVDLVYSIQLVFAERDDRRLSAPDVRRRLLALVNDEVFSIQYDSDLRPALKRQLPLSPAPLFASPHPDPVQAWILRPA